MFKIVRDILSPQSGYSFNTCTGEALMFHTTLGYTYAGAHETLKIRHLSYHFIIDEFGDIFQLIDINRGAWGAGATARMNLRARAFFGNTNPNLMAVQIAFVRKGQPEINQQQRDAGVWLTKYIGQQTKVRYNADNMFYHREVTNYSAWAKPPEVRGYMQQVLDGVRGNKDNTDVGEKTRMQLIIKLLLLQIKLLKLKLLTKK